ncbi:MAG: flagellar biosynthetic protein FliR [Phenylobacterium sp.]|jgi:flagellar biosynthetic protein FliR
MNTETKELILIMARITPLFAGVGISPFSRIPLMVRLVLVLMFALAISQLIDVSISPLIPTNRPVLLALVNELMFGLVVLLVLQAALSSVLFWGRVVDMQVGFGAAAILNPATHSQDSMLGTMVSLAVVTVFFLSGVHHLLLQFMFNSFQVFPLGGTVLNLSAHKLAMFFGLEYLTAMLLFAPVMMVIWTLDVMVGFLSKTMPQMNIYFVTLPLKIAVGISVLAVSVNYSKALLDTLFAQMLTFLNGL